MNYVCTFIKINVLRRNIKKIICLFQLKNIINKGTLFFNQVTDKDIDFDMQTLLDQIT